MAAAARSRLRLGQRDGRGTLYPDPVLEPARPGGGDIRREVIGLAANGVELNKVSVTLTRLADDVTKVAQVSPDAIIEPGDTVTHAINITPDPIALAYNNGAATYILTDTLPVGMTYLTGTARLLRLASTVTRLSGRYRLRQNAAM